MQSSVPNLARLQLIASRYDVHLGPKTEHNKGHNKNATQNCPKKGHISMLPDLAVG
jgi:hypothetical protein